MVGPVISNKKELIAFQLYYQNEGELFSLLQQKISEHLLKQRRFEEKNWKLSLQKEEHSIRSLVHFILDKKMATREEMYARLSQNQKELSKLYRNLII